MFDDPGLRGPCEGRYVARSLHDAFNFIKIPTLQSDKCKKHGLNLKRDCPQVRSSPKQARRSDCFVPLPKQLATLKHIIMLSSDVPNFNTHCHIGHIKIDISCTKSFTKLSWNINSPSSHPREEAGACRFDLVMVCWAANVIHVAYW